MSVWYLKLYSIDGKCHFEQFHAVKSDSLIHVAPIVTLHSDSK